MEVIRYTAERGDYGPGHPAAYIQKFGDIARSHQPHHIQRSLPNSIALSIRGNPLPGGGTVATITDVTTSKQWEAALARQKTLFEAIFRYVPDALILSGADGKIVTCNAGASATFGYGIDNLIGMPLRSLYATGEEFLRHTDRHSSAVGSPIPELICYRRQDGGAFIGDARGSLIKDHEDETLGYLHVIRDVSELKKAERQLQLTQHSIDRVSDGAFWILSDGRFTDVNETACRVLDYSRRDLLALSVFVILPELTPEQWDRNWKLIKAGVAFTRPARLRTSAGKLFPAEISASFVEFDGKEYVCIFARDVTDRVATEERLRQSQKMEALGQLAGGVAHEFNNILTSVMGFTRMALQKIDRTDRVKECLTEVLESSKRAADLTRQMLTFSHKQVLEPRVLRVGPTIRGMEKLLRTLVEASIDLEWAIGDAESCIEADPTRLSQCIVNLVVNGRHALPDGGRIRIGVERAQYDAPFFTSHGDELPPGVYARIDVSDDGIGIEPATLQHIFEPFFTTKKAGQGTGLGLSLVYGMVKNSGGAIHVESAVGKGTTFSIYMPTTDQEPAADASFRDEPESPMGDSETILLAEDDPQLRRFVKQTLEDLGYAVLAASDGAHAIKIFEEHGESIDLLLTDVVMPEVDGLRLAKALTAARPDLKIIFMTGYAPELTDLRAKLQDDITLLNKPFRPDVLGGVVRQTLERRDATEGNAIR
ncbi:MAG: PAS domain S-box protein [Rhodospirillales bacterium]|nr:PAS domain S-box protein [Rhodospirillales bacterium]